MPEIRIIALDLDGTLLNTDKKLSSENLAALEAASALGIEIVPTTGRLFHAMPEVIRTLPFLHYAITCNGASVYDIQKGKTVASAEIPLETGLAVMELLDQYPVMYDCYADNEAFMTRSLYEHAEDFAPDAHVLKMVKTIRTPVPELKEFIRQKGHPLQKMQFYVKELPLRDALQQLLSQRFPELYLSSSCINNLEINIQDANKGNALRLLADYLGTDLCCTMAFGDGSNDRTMIEAAGIGIAMENGIPELKAIADAIAPHCDRSGVAYCIDEYILSKVQKGAHHG